MINHRAPEKKTPMNQKIAASSQNQAGKAEEKIPAMKNL